MSVNKRGKTWQIRVSYKNGAGKFRTISKGGFKTKAAAMAYEAQLKVDIQNDDTDNKKLSFIDYYDSWLNRHLKQNLKQQTVLNHIATQKIVHQYFDDIKINDLTRTDIQDFVNEFSKTHQPSTTRQTLIRISMPLRDAFNDGIIKRNPTTGIKIPDLKNQITKINYLEPNDMRKLQSYIEEHSITDKTFAIYIAILSGARLGEILALTYADIDEHAKTITISKNKTNHFPYEYVVPKTKSSFRTISMPASFFQQLHRYQKEYPNADEHFLGESHDQKYFSREFLLILEKLNLKRITFHALRHTHASYLINNGIDVAYVSERLGHSNISVTERTYFHLLQDKRISENEKTINLLN